MPIAPPDTHRIKDFDQLNDPIKLLDTVLEAETASGVDKNYKVTFPTVIQTVANNLPGTNRIKSAYKAVRTYDTQSAGYQAGFDTLVGLDDDTLCIGTLARVEFPSPARDYILVFDANSSLYVYTDGAFTGQKQPARWVEKNSYDNLTASIEDFNPFQAEYDAGYNVKYTIAGSLRIFSAKAKLDKSTFSNNQIPAPTGLISDPNWTEISPEAAPNFSRLGQLVCRFYSNAERAADPYPFGDTVEDLIARENAGASILFDKRLVYVALGPQAGTYEVTYNPTSPEFDAWADGSFVGGRNPCSFEKLSTSTTAVTNWLAGPQTANTLVFYNGNIYRVKQDIANGQAAPDTNTQYYQLINADVTKAYVDAADSNLQSQITTEKNRMDTLVDNAPQALDTLKEIADQLAADQQGAAAILATQQQHTQELANVVHRTGDESIAGKKSFVDKLKVIYNDNNYADGLVLQNSNSSGNALAGLKLTSADGVNGGIMQYIPPTFSYPQLVNTMLFGSYGKTRLGFVANSASIDNTAQDIYFTTLSGRQAAIYINAANADNVGIGTNTPNQKLHVEGYIYTSKQLEFATSIPGYFGNFEQPNGYEIGFSKPNTQLFTINLQNNNSYFPSGNVGIGNNTPSEKLDVSGNVKAVSFIGDGSRLTGLPASGVSQTYVDAADTALRNQITTEKNRIDTLVIGAPQALDTLKEIADQLAADEAGAAAILATQQQHTQQLANVVHRTGDESIAGIKTFTSGINAASYSSVDGNVKMTFANRYGFNGAMLSNTIPLVDLGWQVGGKSLAIRYETRTGLDFFNTPFQLNQANEDKGSFHFIDPNVPGTSQTSTFLAISPKLILVRNGVKLGINNDNPTELVEVGGNVKAVKFIGDGSLLTNLPGGGGAGGGSTIYQLPATTIAIAGAQTITLPNAATAIINIMVLEPNGYVRTIWLDSYSVAGTTLTITVDANLKADDKIAGSYY